METILCAFGCGRTSVRQLKNGKFICSQFAAQCPVLRARNNADRRGMDLFAGRPHPRGMAGKTAWNKGRSFDELYDALTLERLRAVSRLSAQKLVAHNHFRRQSPELEASRRKKISDTARRVGMGGYRRGSGRGKKGWYRGHWCDSTYELAFVVWALDYEVPFVRNLEFFPYEYEGRVLHWMPDFLLADGTYIEIKGYLTDQARAEVRVLPSATDNLHASGAQPHG
jgi:hypothetical protein